MDEALVAELEGFLQGVKSRLQMNLELRNAQLEELRRVGGRKR